MQLVFIPSDIGPDKITVMHCQEIIYREFEPCTTFQVYYIVRLCYYIMNQIKRILTQLFA